MELTPDETKLRDELQQQLGRFPINGDYPERTKSLTDMCNIAVKLHQSLKQHGFEPKHHAYMIANRGMKPDEPGFYFHLHPIEDLIKFTFNPNSNEDTVDLTVGHDFDFRVFTRRWGHDDVYTVKRTATGWFVQGAIFSGPCDKTCTPVLFECLRHDGVQYPRNVGDWFEWLWQQAKDKGLNHDAVQQGINDIVSWISLAEKAAPVGGIWAGLA